MNTNEPTPPFAPRPEAETRTPETEEFYTKAYGSHLTVDSKLDRDFARQLERQRDQAIAERDSLRICFAEAFVAHEELKPLRAELDALRQALEGADIGKAIV